jgi:hypothetical protein
MPEKIILRNAHLSLALSTDGLVSHFKPAHPGKNYLDSAAPHHFMSVRDKAGAVSTSTEIAFRDGFLRLTFGASGIVARVHVRLLPTYMTFELVALSNHALTRVELINLPLTLTPNLNSRLTACVSSEYAAAVIPLNIDTHSRLDPQAAYTSLIAEADGRVRLEGARFAVVGCGTPMLLTTIEKIEQDNGLPHPTLSGVWAKKSPEQSKSYLFIDVTETTAPHVIDYAKAGGFGYIVLYANAWAATRGSYPPKPGLMAISDKIHDAGLKFGIHNLDMVISKDDALVTPVPASGFLMYPDLRRFLAVNISDTDRRIPITQAPAGFLQKGETSRYKGHDLRIDNEIITYESLDLTASSYAFEGCTRGAYGTVPAPHAAGTAVDNFAEFLKHYLPDVQDALYDTVAGNLGAALERFKVDYVYPDGVAENVAEYPPVIPIWFVDNLLVSKFYHSTWRELMFAQTPISDYSWHVFSRSNTTDFVTRGIIEHFNMSSLPAAQDPWPLQPFEFGWFGYFRWTPDAAATRPRELAYAWAKALAYNAAVGLETTQADLDTNGRTKENLAVIKTWEQLKRDSYFNKSIRDQLKVPGKEFILDDSAGSWKAVPVTYSPEKYVAALDGVQNIWTLHSTDPDQPLRLSLAAAPTLAKYGDEKNKTLLDPAKPLALITIGNGPLGKGRSSRPDLSLKLEVRSTPSPDGSPSFGASLANTSESVAWACAQLVIKDDKGVEGVDLRSHRALSAWVKGDKSGAVLHFVIEDADELVRDYYTVLDFDDWRQVAMLEPAAGEVFDFDYVYSNYWALYHINLQAIKRIYVFLTNVPPKRQVNCLFGRVEALQEFELPMNNPGLTVEDRSIMFPTTLQSADYLEYEGEGAARVFDRNGKLKTTVTPEGSSPYVRTGDHKITFFCDTQGAQAAKVTIMTRGAPLT